MDPFSHMLLAYLLSFGAFGPGGLQYVVAGAFAGALPDLDVVFLPVSRYVPLLRHRGISHSLLGVTVLAVVGTFVVPRGIAWAFGSAFAVGAPWAYFVALELGALPRAPGRDGSLVGPDLRTVLEGGVPLRRRPHHERGRDVVHGHLLRRDALRAGPGPDLALGAHDLPPPGPGGHLPHRAPDRTLADRRRAPSGGVHRRDPAGEPIRVPPRRGEELAGPGAHPVREVPLPPRVPRPAPFAGPPTARTASGARLRPRGRGPAELRGGAGRFVGAGGDPPLCRGTALGRRLRGVLALPRDDVLGPVGRDHRAGRRCDRPGGDREPVASPARWSRTSGP